MCTVWHGGHTIPLACAIADVTSSFPTSSNSINSNSVWDNASWDLKGKKLRNKKNASLFSIESR